MDGESGELTVEDETGAGTGQRQRNQCGVDREKRV